VRFSGDVEKRESVKREKGREAHKRTVKESSGKAQKQKSERYVETRKNITDTTASAQQPIMKTGTGIPTAQRKLAKFAAMAFSKRTAEA